MKIVLINKSDSTGGAAVVSMRLMQALRRAGVDARMVVAEKLSDSPFVQEAAPRWRMKIPFLAERLKIFLENGLNRSTLFKIDTASDGLSLLSHPWVRDADVVMLNWVNQGLLSLKGIRRIAATGKKIIWTMHDMWCFTGICHHSGKCEQYRETCRNCPLLAKGWDKRLARRIQKRKNKLYRGASIEFVAVSNWLANRGRQSSLFEGKKPTVIPNAFPFDDETVNAVKTRNPEAENREIRILFGAARLDDTVKGLPILIEATHILARRYPEWVSRLRLVTFGEVKNSSALDGIAIPHSHLGRVSGRENLKKVYRDGDIVVSTSLYETLPGTLVEGQAYGAIPVAFDRGGQSDIITHHSTGYLARWDDDLREAAANIADGVIWASEQIEDEETYKEILQRMYANARLRFNEEAVAARYLQLINGS